jgi:flavorubredoxin
MSRPIPVIVRAFVAELDQAIRREILEKLRRAAAVPIAAPTASARARQTIRVTDAGLKARRQQGKYLGLLRGLPPKDRARVQKIARERGVRFAIAAGAKLKRG